MQAIRDTINLEETILSIIIVNYNSADYCLACLNSIELSADVEIINEAKVSSGDNAKYRIEVIVVDNNSQDDSIDLITRHHPWARLIRMKKNVGYSEANNFGAQVASGKYILLLNPDTLLEPTTLGGMIDYLDKNKDIGATTCFLEMKMTGDLDLACHRGLPTPWASFCYFTGFAKIWPTSRLFGGYHLTWERLDKEHEIDSPVGAFYMLPREVYWGVGGLDQSYFLYGEDLDLSYRIKSKGYRVTFNPEFRAYHYKGVSSGIKRHSHKHVSHLDIDRDRAFQAFYDSMKIFYKKHLARRYPFFINWLVFLCIELQRELGKRKKLV